jgi:4-hydroxybenzoate polyprenyltransferase
VIRGLALTLRPQQWVKNLFVLAAVVFAERLTDPAKVRAALAALGIFCLAAGGNYVLNDLIDRDRDRLHPRKRSRPIARGDVPAGVAVSVAVLLEAAAIGLGFLLDPTFGLLIVAYLGAMAAYSLALKRIAILDVFVIAGGFVLRVVAGAVAIHEPASEWLVLCTIFLALFLGFGKRRAELAALGEDPGRHREALADYDRHFLDQIIGVCTASVVTCYALYALEPGTVARFGPFFVSTIAFVVFGIFRYLFLLHCRDGGGSPTRALLRDVPTLVNVLLWMATVLACVYGRPGLT